MTFSYAGSELAALACPQPKGRAPIRCKAPPQSVIAARAALVWAATGRQVAEAKAMSQKAASAKADAQIAKGALQKAASAREAHQERKTPAAKALAPMQGIPEDDGYYSTWPIPEVASAPTWASAPFSAPSAHPAVPASASPAPAVAPAASKAPPPILELKAPPPRLEVKAPPPHLTAKAPPPQLTTTVSASATSAPTAPAPVGWLEPDYDSQQVSSASAASAARADDRLVRFSLHPRARQMMQDQERATELRLEERRLTERLQEQEHSAHTVGVGS